MFDAQQKTKHVKLSLVIIILNQSNPNQSINRISYNPYSHQQSIIFFHSTKKTDTTFSHKPVLTSLFLFLSQTSSMAESTKHVPNSDIKTLFSIFKTTKTIAFAYAFMLAFLSLTLFLAFSPSPNPSSPWFTNFFTTKTSSSSSSIFSFFYHNTTTTSSLPSSPFSNTSRSTNNTSHVSDEAKPQKMINQTANREQEIHMMKSLRKCDFFDGKWVKDNDSYPLYQPGSCNLIDQQFNCISNGRPDQDFQKFKWKPKGCSLPRLDGHKMLDLLRGKRLVFVGDSINRNMWESLICILRNSVKDKSKVFEANGRVHFKGETSYSFIFKDYNFSIELFVSPFLVQEWEYLIKNGTKKETLRLDLVGKSSDQYKDADIIIFNTGHWWTHDKTSKGKDYYQEGSHVYNELNVLEAFRKAITTWSRWVDANINATKSMVFFRGYSSSHFSGGQWNSGGQCDSEIAPIKNENYLRQYPPKMRVLEKVLKNMKTRVTYLNVTKMTDFRKDGHPSIYRKQNLSSDERKSPLMYQDCSHWCLPGVPDTWNEILYAELLMKQYPDQNQNHNQNRH
ncbi:protein trichome birefringence-like 1 [Vicia villosa]|uniref:protein trichome birefringence-like 1 n=1 Tax=Vicia villosa TaxID=3911 RepID=UPI00273ABC3A|nr:protein trichome birefringence-like 1 [Vicia villosa]